MVFMETVSKSEKDYYEVLGIEKNADPQEIKRAYFSLVRQFPPERFPEEFKALRAAYDTLADEKKRAEYDETDALPEEIKPLFYQAQMASDRGRHTQAAELYRTILQIHPKLRTVQEEYAWTLEDAGKNGKALEVWEQLCEQESANAEYAINLARSYDHRGWRKKALDQYRRALEFDKDNQEYWVELVNYHGKAQELDEAKAVCQQAMATIGEKAHIELYLCAYSICESEDFTAAEKYLQNILSLAEKNPPDEENLLMVVTVLLTSLVDPDRVQFYPFIKKLADMLPSIDDEMRSGLEWSGRNFDIQSLEAKGFHELFHDLFITLNNNFEAPEAQNEKTAMECYLLSEPETFRPQLIRLKKEYPQLYDLHKAFFDEVMRTRDLEIMLHRRMKKLDKKKYRSVDTDGEEEDGWDSEPVVQTVHRESPKIGRNDPCPCGSGKKYKKCCGA
jgi:tetratricopeptide (TPR) repeat protein